MKQIFHEIIIKTKGQNLYDFTEKTKDWVSTKKFCNGILSINVLHTSASLIIQENADPDVLHDLIFFFNKSDLFMIKIEFSSNKSFKKKIRSTNKKIRSCFNIYN